jgi:hypothetical protein
MDKVLSTKQLTRGQKVVHLDIQSGNVSYYRFISENLSNVEKIKEHYAYFANEWDDRPTRFYLGGEGGAPLYVNYTEKEILVWRHCLLTEELREVDAELNKQ